jgi:hypothetical protein
VSKIDNAASIGPESGVLRDEKLDAVSGGLVAQKKQLRAAQGKFEELVSDAVVTAGELATIHSMK